MTIFASDLIDSFSRIKTFMVMKAKIVLIILLISSFSWGQMLIPNTTPLTQNFDGLGATATLNSTMTGFKQNSISTVADINIKGNNKSIANNSLFPSGLNHTAFGTAFVGTSTVTRIFTIENLGTTPLSLTGTPLVSIGGFSASSFSITQQPTSNLVLNGSSLTFSVIFNPTTLGAKNAEINILSNDSDEILYKFNISGNAKGASNVYVTGNNNSVLKATTSTSLTNDTNFGAVSITSGINQNAFLLTNLSSASITINSFVISGTDASLFTLITNPTTNSISSGTSTSFVINFSPTSIGVKKATVTFTTSDTVDATFTFAISGTGSNYIPCTIGAIQTIAIQDFEDVPATPTWSYTNVTNGMVNIAGGNFKIPTNVNGYIGFKSLQFKSATGAVETNVINLDPINTSQYTNINMSLKVAALRTGTKQGLDVGDFIEIETSVDNGVNWSAESKLAGFSNSRWSFNATGVFDVYYSGLNNGANIDSKPGAGELPGGLATYNLRNLPVSKNLLIRITMSNDDTAEIWAIDNIKIEGQIPVSSTWNGTTWSPAAPTTSTKAIIDGDYNIGINGNITTCECQVKPGKILNIETGAAVPMDPYLEIQSNLFNEGIINIQNGANLVQINDAANNSGSGIVNVNRITPNFDLYDYTYWSSPVKSDIIGTRFAAWNLNNIYTFNTANYSDLFSGLYNPTTQTIPGSDGFDDNGDAWTLETLPNVKTMIPATGYAIMAKTTGTFPRAETVTFSGEINNGIISNKLALSANTASDTDDFNLVGNPYPSSIKADDFIKANILPLGSGNNITGTLYFWTHKGNLEIVATNPGPSIKNYSGNDYAMYNLTGSTGTASVSGSLVPTGFIAAGQGFFIEAETTNDLIFDNSMRNKTYSNSAFFRNSNPVKDRFWLNLQNTDQMFSQQLIAYLPETTKNFDYGYDGISNNKLSYLNFYSYLKPDDNSFYKIQSRSDFNINDTVQLGFSSAVSGQTSINIDKTEGIFDNQDIYLQDNLLNITHNLKVSPYTFTTNFGTFNDRFILKYISTPLSNTEFETTDNQLIVAVKDNQIKIISGTDNIKNVKVFDILGRNLFDKNLVNAKTVEINNLTVKNQAVIVKVEKENGQIITKKIIL